MSVERILSEALELGEVGDWQAMADLLVTGLEEAEDDPYLLCWLGVAERELGNEGAAHDYFRRCLEQDPLDPHLLAMAGSGLASFDDAEAEPALRAAALSAPDLPVARLQYGAYLARAGLFEEALQHLNAARELAPEDPAVHGELGAALALTGELRPAIDAMETALDLAPEDDWTRLLLGLLYADAGRLEEAAEALVASARERDDDVEAQVLAALAAAAMGWEEAAHLALATAGLAVEEPAEQQLTDEVEERILQGAVAARAMLLEVLGPSVMRDRLRRPL